MCTNCYKSLDRIFSKITHSQIFNNNPNNLHEAFRDLTSIFTNNFSLIPENIINSFSIALAKNKKIFNGKVASEVCDEGYCTSKDFYYYGCKLDVIANVRPKFTPYPKYALLAKMFIHGLESIRDIFLNLENHKIYTDKAYAHSELKINKY